MKSLLIVAHGSRRKESNDEVRQLTKTVAELNNDFDEVECAFLELDTPLIPDGIRNAISRGANEVVVMPYFLSAGRHVAKDIPADVSIVQKEFPKVKITIAQYLGLAKQIPEILLQQAKAS